MPSTDLVVASRFPIKNILFIFGLRCLRFARWFREAQLFLSELSQHACYQSQKKIGPDRRKTVCFFFIFSRCFIIFQEVVLFSVYENGCHNVKRTSLYVVFDTDLRGKSKRYISTKQKLVDP